jgi:hypothetical protein
MPKVNDLPEALAILAFKQAFTVRHDSFGDDISRLAQQIQKLAGEFLKKKAKKEFEETIGHDFDSGFILEDIADDFRLRLYFASKAGINTYFNSHLLRDAITHLIEGADVGGWMKYENELQPDAFYTAILRAVAASYRVDIPYPTDEQSDTDILRLLLSDLENLSGE